MFEAMFSDELYIFYAHFDALNKNPTVKSTSPPEDQELTVSTLDVREILRRVNMRKAARPEMDHVLKYMSRNYDGLNWHSQKTVPNCFKTATIIPVPKRSTVPLLTPIRMKCFKKLVLQHISDNITA